MGQYQSKGWVVNGEGINKRVIDFIIRMEKQ